MRRVGGLRRPPDVCWRRWFEARGTALFHPDTAAPGVRIAELAADRFLMHYRVVRRRHGPGRIVSNDYRAKTSAALPDAIAARMREPEMAILVKAR